MTRAFLAVPGGGVAAWSVAADGMDVWSCPRMVVLAEEASGTGQAESPTPRT